MSVPRRPWVGVAVRGGLHYNRPLWWSRQARAADNYVSKCYTHKTAYWPRDRARATSRAFMCPETRIAPANPSNIETTDVTSTKQRLHMLNGNLAPAGWLWAERLATQSSVGSAALRTLEDVKACFAAAAEGM